MVLISVNGEHLNVFFSIFWRDSFCQRLILSKLFPSEYRIPCGIVLSLLGYINAGFIGS